MQWIIKILALGNLIGACVSCTPQQSSAQAIPFPYQLDQPDQHFELDDELEEISGLSYFAPNLIACVQDEEGEIYIYDLKDKEITARYKFAEDGDYEGIEMVGDTAYVLRSDGTIFEVSNFKAGNPSTQIWRTFLDEDNDTEGLAYHPAQNTLWIACKGEAVDKNSDKNRKAIYTFDLNQHELQAPARIIIQEKKLEDFADEKLDFHPSALAWHPSGQQLYILASKGQQLVVLDNNGTILHVKELDKDHFGQPEGICFDPAGNLYISNEKNEEDANILRFQVKH